MPIIFSWPDIVLLVISGLFAFFGWRSGMIKMVFNLCSFAVAIILAWVLHPLLSGYLRTTMVYNSLLDVVKKYIPNMGATQVAPLPDDLQGALAQSSQEAGNWLAEYFVALLLNVIAFVLVLVLVKLILFIVRKLLNLFTELPGIGFLNRLAGLGLGILEGALVVCVVLAVVYAIPSFRNNDGLNMAIENAPITSKVYVSNPVLNWLLPESDFDGGLENGV